MNSIVNFTFHKDYATLKMFTIQLIILILNTYKYNESVYYYWKLILDQIMIWERYSFLMSEKFFYNKVLLGFSGFFN